MELKGILKGIKGAIFDLDGTLLDSLWVWEEIDKRFLSKRGYEVPPDYSQAISAMNFFKAAEYTIERFRLSETPENLMGEWLEMARDIYANEIFLKPRAKEFLNLLAKNGVKLGIATSSDADLYMPALIRNGIDKMFSVIMNTNGLRGKDFPDVYLSVAAKMGLDSSECVVFEDLPVALRSASSEGFKTVAVVDRHYCETEYGDMRINGFEELL